MEKRFTALRIVATLWKILAWVSLIVGILAAIGTLIASIVGGGMMGPMMRQYGFEGQIPTGVFGVVSGVITFLVMLIATVFYFLVFYAVGEGISLALAIEENTRLTAQWVAARAAPAQPVYTPPQS